MFKTKISDSESAARAEIENDHKQQSIRPPTEHDEDPPDDAGGASDDAAMAVKTLTIQ